MAQNVGGIDKWLRIAVGIILIVLGLFGPLGWWGALGLVPLLTGLAGHCPLYSVIGANTCTPEERKA